MKFHCLFEQSGTFKNVLKNHGHSAVDYDIENQFNQTDVQIDLFAEIEKSYASIMDGKTDETIFAKMRRDTDFIIAFFPCTHFSSMNEVKYKVINKNHHQIDADDIKYVIGRNRDRSHFFEVYLKFCYVTTWYKIPTIIENPATGRTYLELFSPVPVAWHEQNRVLWGDDFVKPTNFYAINFEMIETFRMYEPRAIHYAKNENKNGIFKSLISPVYAENFYKRFLENYLEKGENK